LKYLGTIKYNIILKIGSQLFIYRFVEDYIQSIKKRIPDHLMRLFNAWFQYDVFLEKKLLPKLLKGQK